ncbi:hypothetical protein IW140_004562 [Coemansia sp. RSA 1813]|nr:hypothetical protein EV178_004655 [Coemansia sp. RSA 1646]KAJ1769365.1 hypothetical protein LPJ74_004129 [Coemansia sp. RSA 1843]KAJ2087745.1 hypothetical protein IW138_004773 [Coemansia sp. RSA 986]KAJ2213089.1 hypothetical protein EV179_004150 [Coemansia sp. RSA 487]KAJ2567214.1 hypothetical protein IW140_004562 [Coemansia sp. RSA 1813]
MCASVLSISHHVSSADANTVADIERRIFSSSLSEQSPGLRAARRKFLELNDLLEAGEKHGTFGTKTEILLGWARTLELSACADSTHHLLNVKVDSTTRPPVPHTESSSTANGEVFLHIEAKHSRVSEIPGMGRVSRHCPSDIDGADEKWRLLSTHAQYIGELAGEAELLTRLCSHAKEHPIYEAARGLESYFGGLIDSLCLKLKIIAGDMHQTLYSPSTIKALERLHAILKAKETSLKKERSALDERLSIYKDAGNEFQDIASSYAAILKECDQVRGDIAQVSEL